MEIGGVAYWTVNTTNTKLFSGFPEGRTIDLGGIKLEIGKTRLGWTTIKLSSSVEKTKDGESRITLKPEFKTVWYEIEIQ